MRVFISCISSDARFAQVVREVLTKEGFEVWDPERDLLPGSNWLKETGRAIDDADAIVLLLSDRSLLSPAMKREIAYAITQLRYENRVIPVRIGAGQGKIPWILKNLSVIHAPSIDAAASTARKIGTHLRVQELVTRAVSGMEKKAPKMKRKATAPKSVSALRATKAERSPRTAAATRSRKTTKRSVTHDA